MKIEPPTQKEILRDINELLDDYYKTRIKRAERFSESYERLWKIMFEVHRAGGKRLRPRIMLLAYQGYGGKNLNDILPIAAALELLHTSLLIHDDIIDRDFIRHNQPNVAGQYRKIYKTSPDGEHFANSAALLAGNLALSGSYQLILEGSIPGKEKLQVMKLLGDGIFVVAGGELLDLEAVLLPFESVDTINIANLKTAHYSIIIPLLIGASLAHADPAEEKKLRELGLSLGIAFQLTDDLLGIYGDETKTGKPITSDLEEGKRTYLMQKAFTLADKSERAELEDLLAAPTITKRRLLRVRKILDGCGARAATEQAVKKYIEQSEKSLKDLKISEQARTEINSLIAQTANRSY